MLEVVCAGESTETLLISQPGAEDTQETEAAQRKVQREEGIAAHDANLHSIVLPGLVRPVQPVSQPTSPLLCACDKSERLQSLLQCIASPHRHGSS